MRVQTNGSQSEHILYGDEIKSVSGPVEMPKVDGIEVLRTIKNDANLKPIPVVMLTSSREERDLAQSYALGANAYVVKPVEFQQFISAVKELGVFWGVINEPPPGGTKSAA